MDKKIEHIFRERLLSAEEITGDAAVRRQVRAEFPPAQTSGISLGRLSETLRDALRASNKSIEQIAQETGVSPILLSRFVAGERDIHMDTADKLAEALGLKLAAAS